MKNEESIPTLTQVFDLVRESALILHLDLKDGISEKNVKMILESGIAMDRIRLAAFRPEYLQRFETASLLTPEQLTKWNSIPRYLNTKYPNFGKREFRKSLHLVAAFAFGLLGSKDVSYGAWEVNYSLLIRLMLTLQPEFIVTKSPSDCHRLRDEQGTNK